MLGAIIGDIVGSRWEFNWILGKPLRSKMQSGRPLLLAQMPIRLVPSLMSRWMSKGRMPSRNIKCFRHDGLI